MELASAKQAAEFQRLYDEWSIAAARATAVLRQHGMHSQEFREADAAAGDLWVKLRKLQGKEGQHWMA